MGIEKLDGMETSQELRPDSNPEESRGAEEGDEPQEAAAAFLMPLDFRAWRGRGMTRIRF